MQPRRDHPTQTHPQQAAPLWTIERQELNQRFMAGQDPVSEWTVYFRVRNGVLGWVVVPADQYTAETVAAVIQPAATIIEAVGSLHGPTQ